MASSLKMMIWERREVCLNIKVSSKILKNKENYSIKAVDAAKRSFARNMKKIKGLHEQINWQFQIDVEYPHLDLINQVDRLLKIEDDDVRQ